MESVNTKNAMGGFTGLLSTSAKPTRLPLEGLSKFGQNVASEPQADKNATKKRALSEQDSEADELVQIRKPKKKRTPLPTHRLDPNINVIITKEAASVISGPESRPAIRVQQAKRMNNATKPKPALPDSSLEQTTAIQTNITVLTKPLPKPAPSALLKSSSYRSDSVTMSAVLSPVHTEQTNIQVDGFAIPWDTMLFTKRAAIANLATLGRNIKGAVKGDAGKSDIANSTRELAYAECTSVDFKQYMLASPGDSAAIRRIWPELVIFNATGSISYEIIGQSLVEWGPNGIDGLEEFELIVLGWMRLAEIQQLSRLDRLVEHKNEDPTHLLPFLQVRGVKLNARFWTPKGLKKLREDIWEVIDGGEEFRRKTTEVAVTIGLKSAPQVLTSHLSLLRDGLGIYRFRIQPHHLSAATPEYDERASNAGNASKLHGHKQLAMR
ncbi:hypothetical protein DL98DRAFT_529143 [Cadophora sp. DSE1049]|nr:hypothetical protein DL98DRAFT_529143 [Cadophora sp. DSE1049]